MSEILKINFRSEYLVMIRKKILDSISRNEKSVCINGKLEPFAIEELENEGYKVVYNEHESYLTDMIPEHTEITWDYEHINEYDKNHSRR